MALEKTRALEIIIDTITYYEEKLDTDMDLLKIHLNEENRLCIQYYIDKYNKDKEMLDFYRKKYKEIDKE